MRDSDANPARLASDRWRLIWIERAGVDKICVLGCTHGAAAASDILQQRNSRTAIFDYEERTKIELRRG
jgi:glutamate racemase